MRKRVHRAVLAVSAGMLIVALVSSGAALAGATKPAPQILQVSLPDRLVGCDPVGHVVSTSTAQVLSLVLPSAYTATAQGTVAQADSILDQAEVVDLNPLTVDFQLKAGAVWADGTPISVKDFIATWHIGMEGKGVAAQQYRMIRSVRAGISPGQIVVVFKKPTNSWQALFSPLLPQSATPAVLSGCSSPSALIDLSAGPYEVATSSPSEVTLVKNPRWWGHQPMFDSVSIEAGAPISWPISAASATLAEREWLSSAELDGITSQPSSDSHVDPSNRILSLNFDVRHGSTRSLSLRRAIISLVNRQEIVASTVNEVAPQIAVAGSSLLSQGQPNYSGPAPIPTNATTTTTEPAGSSAQVATSSSTTTTIPSTRTHANTLLQRAGYHLSRSRWISSGGTSLSLRLVVPLDDGWALEVAPILQKQFAVDHVGIHLDFVASSRAVARELVTGRGSLGLMARPTDPFIDHAVAWFSAAPKTPISSLWSGFTSKVIVKIASQASMDMNPTTAEPLYQDIANEINLQAPSLPIFTEPLVTAWSSSISNLTPNAYPPGTLADLLTWSPSAAAG